MEMEFFLTLIKAYLRKGRRVELIERDKEKNMRVLMEKIFQFIREEDGQTSTEYILLVAVVALIVFKFKSVATTKLTALTNSIFDKAETSIQNDSAWQ